MSALVKAKCKVGSDTAQLIEALRLRRPDLKVEGAGTLDGYYTLRGKSADVIIRRSEASRFGVRINSDFGFLLGKETEMLFEDVDQSGISQLLFGNSAYAGSPAQMVANLYSAAGIARGAQNEFTGLEFSFGTNGVIEAEAFQRVSM